MSRTTERRESGDDDHNLVERRARPLLDPPGSAQDLEGD